MTVLGRPLSRRIMNRLRHYYTYLRPEWNLARSKAWQAHPDLLQPWPLTRANRHPDFFALVAERLRGRPGASVLSFGCSTGEEAISLARHLPAARIHGIDINPACIARAVRLLPPELADRVTFEAAAAPPDVSHGYDAIFCLSVLRHARLDAEQPATCTAILPFARFAAMIAGFDRALKPGGLLVVWGGNFRFADTTQASRYRQLPVPGRRPQRGVFYGPDDRLLPITADDGWIFEKLG